MDNRENLVERPVMEEKEFKKYLEDGKKKVISDFENNGTLVLRFFDACSKFKSIRRAIRRGHVSLFGEIYPKRPFNNRRNTSNRRYTHSRVMNEKRKLIYGELKQR